MTPTDFALAVTDLQAEQQNEFFRIIKEELTVEEYNATLLFITHIGVYRSAEKKEALKNAVREMMLGKYYGHPSRKPE
jgi:hypothetical protein